MDAATKLQHIVEPKAPTACAVRRLGVGENGASLLLHLRDGLEDSTVVRARGGCAVGVTRRLGWSATATQPPKRPHLSPPREPRYASVALFLSVTGRCGGVPGRGRWVRSGASPVPLACSDGQRSPPPSSRWAGAAVGVAVWVHGTRVPSAARCVRCGGVVGTQPRVPPNRCTRVAAARGGTPGCGAAGRGKGACRSLRSPRPAHASAACGRRSHHAAGV